MSPVLFARLKLAARVRVVRAQRDADMILPPFAQNQVRAVRK